MPPRRKVALLMPNLTLGGAEGQAVTLATGLREVGWEPILLTAESHGPLRERIAAEGLPLFELEAELFRRKSTPGFWANLGRTVWRISRICRRERVAILQSFLFWQNQLAVPAAMVTPGLRVITGRRNTGEFKDRRTHYQRIENLANRFTSAVVCNSEMVRKDALAREHVRRDRLHVIYNGVDAERFAAGERAELAKLAPQLSRAKAVVGTVGNMKRQKRHDLFLRAIAAARRDMAGLHGVIVGRDLGEEPSLRKLRAELGLEEHVHFAGGVTDTAPWLRAFDLFLLTSDHEGLPNVVLESMAAGCPVVATDVGGVREIIRDGQSGVIIPRRDEATAAHAIVELLNDRSRRNTIAEEARTRVRQQFSTSAMVEAHVRLYEKLLAPSSV